METSSGGNLIVPTGFSARFRAFEPGFPRSSPAAHGGWCTSYAFVARRGRLPFAQMRPQQGTSCSPTPRSHIAHRHQNRILGIAFLAVSLGSTLWRRRDRCRANDWGRSTSAQGWGQRVRLRSASAFGLRRLRSSLRASVPQAPRTGRRGPFVSSWVPPRGGGTDISARLIAQPLAEILGQAVVVENRAGAAGTTAAEAVAKSPKDGYNAYMMSNAHAISAVMYKSLRYDPINDFQMVSMVATAGLVLVAAP